MKLFVAIALLFSSLLCHAQNEVNAPLLLSTSQLRKNLIAYWSLEENSGTRYDRGPYGLHLTQGNSPTNIAGKVWYAVKLLSASSQYLTHADDPKLYLSNNFEIHCWVKLYTKNATFDAAGKWNSPTTERGWAIQYDNTSDRFRFLISTDGASLSGTVVADVFGAPSTNVWYHIAVYKDSSNIGISVNNGTFNTLPVSGNVFKTTSPFYIGALQNTPVAFWNGEIDEFGIWSRVLNTTERSQVYSEGLGSHWPWANSLVYPLTAAMTIATNGSTTEAHNCFQNSGIVTAGTKTLVFYVANNLTNYVVQYDSTTKLWSAPILIGSTFSDADHGYASAAVDSKGYIHVFYGCHGNPMNYRRSATTNDGSAWTTSVTVLDRASYPEVLIDQNDYIYCFFRSGPVGYYDRQYGFTKSVDGGTNWSAYNPVCDSGSDQIWVYGNVVKGNENPQNSIQLTWTPRWNTVGTNDSTAFTNIFYAKSLDGGTNWLKSDNSAYSLPISVPSTGEIVYASPCVLSCQMAMTIANKPLILFVKCDPTQYFTNFANTIMLADINDGAWNTKTFPGTNYYYHNGISVGSATTYYMACSSPTIVQREICLFTSLDSGVTWGSKWITANAVDNNINPVFQRNWQTNNIPFSWNDSSGNIYFRWIQ